MEYIIRTYKDPCGLSCRRAFPSPASRSKHNIHIIQQNMQHTINVQIIHKTLTPYFRTEKPLNTHVAKMNCLLSASRCCRLHWTGDVHVFDPDWHRKPLALDLWSICISLVSGPTTSKLICNAMHWCNYRQDFGTRRQIFKHKIQYLTNTVSVFGNDRSHPWFDLVVKQSNSVIFIWNNASAIGPFTMRISSSLMSSPKN